MLDTDDRSHWHTSTLWTKTWTRKSGGATGEQSHLLKSVIPPSSVPFYTHAHIHLGMSGRTYLNFLTKEMAKNRATTP